jgi:hypothetical protein
MTFLPSISLMILIIIIEFCLFIISDFDVPTIIAFFAMIFTGVSIMREYDSYKLRE